MQHNPEIFYNSSCSDVRFDDYLLLGGGTDINPELYGEKNYGYCQSPNIIRDSRNMQAIEDYTDMGKPVIGICRGLQILDVFNGGKLIQHTVGHSSLVPVKLMGLDRKVLEVIDNCRSCHHQVVNPNETNGEIIGYSKYKYNAVLEGGVIEHRSVVPQIVYWPTQKHLAVQFHPEWQGELHPMNVYLRGLIKELLGLENVL